MAVERVKAKSKSELSRIFGVSVNTINSWIKHGLPGEAPFDTGAVFKWHMEHLYNVWEEQSGKKEARQLQDKLNKARMKKEQETARKLKRINEVEEGKLVYTSEVAIMLKAIGSEFRITADTFGKEFDVDMGLLVDRFEDAITKHGEFLSDVVIEGE